jgi:uncharacterized protein (DUF2252 family)
VQPPKLKPEQRETVLDGLRKLKMARSVHAYVRGNTQQFYAWLALAQGNRIPEGPPIWICGDCHVGNLGPIANADGQVEIQIRDLDQTVIGNPAHDLVRLGLSLATAARSSDLPGVTTARMLEQMMEGYKSGLSNRTITGKSSAKANPVRIVLKQALNRRWRQLAKERIEDVSPAIPLGKRFWVLTKEERNEINRIFQSAEVRDLVTCLRQRDIKDELQVLDAAYWSKGCSSLGRLRFAVLLKTGNGRPKEERLCLVDIKEAARAAAPRYNDASMPRDQAKRIVAGARALSPFLGERMLATKFFDRSVVVRELLPQDLKVEMDGITGEEAIASARFLAAVVGRAHARQIDAHARKQWKEEISRNTSKTLDAPSWLWASVVDLIGDHELAYLEHCRKYATEVKTA